MSFGCEEIHGSGSFGRFKSGFSYSPPLCYPDRRVYPLLGHPLGEEHIGKRVVRVFPVKYPDDYDWSFFSENALGEIALNSQKLEAIKDQCLVLEGRFGSHKLPEKFSDRMWCTVEEFTEHLKQNPEAGIAFKDAVPPQPSSGFEEPRLFFGSDICLDSDKMAKIVERLLSPLKKPMDKSPWLEEASRSLPENPGTVDYMFHAPVAMPEDEELDSMSVAPDFTSNDPYDVLGIDPREKNVSVIKKRFRILALHEHPDKGGDLEKFKKLTSAHAKLIEQLATHPFAFSSSLDLESRFKEAEKHQELLDRKGIAFSIKGIETALPPLEQFLAQLMSVDLDGVEKTGIELLFERLIQSTASLLNFYKVKLRVLSMQLPDPSLTPEARIAVLEEQLKVLSECDLNQDSWNRDSEKLFRSAHLAVLDKYLALERSLAEILIKQMNTEKLGEMRQEVRRSVNAKKLALTLGIGKILRKERAFQDKLAKFSGPIRPDFSKQAPPEEETAPPKGDTTAPSPGEAELPKANASGPQAPLSENAVPDDAIVAFKKRRKQHVPFTLVKELASLEENIEKNRLFFDPKHNKFNLFI